ncbi:type II toxin-antitoxin system VapC family toxin [Dyadobacter chenwenxiniae]|uniref:Type II toxin-antitoxin system VapC family toxin n=1 Tax=Dyadobacter chenwenxiniae TaxID=2906456 RepID=A0A9X1PR92_9BACT|nr:type II toxin-antitoxin system VapC family toxin [Dyadobacter chenwenxiniae]MCF0064218.1 type II toxin-antitoxin system VapC family toxin [Dyadobacter chenwenxiniae]UON82566.1 type II toxin-antitoxin system VapC family toxin [Dyadobacter chenwenxiniae]
MVQDDPVYGMLNSNHFLLDTNICIHALKSDFGIKQKIGEVGIDSCFLSEVNIAELLFGVENSAEHRRQLNRQQFESFQGIFKGRILQISDVLHEYARQKTNLRRMGKPIDDFDLLIGCTAVVHNLILVTRNTRHFVNMPGIQLQNWIDQ